MKIKLRTAIARLKAKPSGPLHSEYFTFLIPLVSDTWLRVLILDQLYQPALYDIRYTEMLA